MTYLKCDKKWGKIKKRKRKMANSFLKLNSIEELEIEYGSLLLDWRESYW